MTLIFIAIVFCAVTFVMWFEIKYRGDRIRDLIKAGNELVTVARVARKLSVDEKGAPEPFIVKSLINWEYVLDQLDSFK